ncbi:tripartite tricarboxylate transporter substrate binding protein [Pseudoroseomonas cervicalis]|uniref:Bug family tripartite tricarboxylate transporter substrate binding protein n=1 Tax=Teichococcus cervicalis TaxID=204525 RepID=UPI0022F1605C|nr:tripartite tricarboxylate transporter substrate binding protein [Pseudoroseomonas cervicalis]WBV45199.1 tripartite tricarboxylate transporter substrate binding protein [Pseudoroseomonas cervicalis]
MSKPRGAPALLAACLAVAAILALPGGARAQLPERPVRIIVPFAPGGTSDIVARLLAQGAAPHLPAGAVVENKPGAAGNIGTAEVARAAPDGTVLVQCTIGTCAANPSLYAQPGYDLERSFAPVILTGAVRNVMVVRPGLPARDLAAVLELAKRPDGLSFGSSGVGASNHLTPELLRGRLGLHWVHVPYRGSGPAITDLIGGRIDVFFDNLPSILPHIRAGSVRAIAAVSDRRIPELPEVPSFAEAGLPGIVIDSWFGFMAPAGTPPATVVQLNAAFNKALQEPSIRHRLEEAAVVPLGGPPQRMAEHVRSETARWGEVIRANSIRAE